MRVAPSVELTDEQRQTLEQWARGRSLPARQVERARIVLMAANGELDVAIAAKLGITNQKAARWRARFLALGLVLLCYKRSAPQKGHRASCRSRKPAMVRRSEAMECGLCRPLAAGTSSRLESRRESGGG